MTKTHTKAVDEEFAKLCFDLYVKCNDFKKKFKNKEKQKNIDCNIYYENFIEYTNKTGEK